jgi:hypothetical protein
MAKVEETLDGHFITVSEKEAIETIKSLSTQFLNKSGNAGRVEYGNPYFTIAIEFEKESEKPFSIEDIQRAKQVSEVTEYLRKLGNFDELSPILQNKMIQIELNFRGKK